LKTEPDVQIHFKVYTYFEVTMKVDVVIVLLKNTQKAKGGVK